VIAIYGMGEGLGHLTRITATLHTLGIDPAEAVVLSTSRHGLDRRVTGGLGVSPTAPTEVSRALRELAPTELWVDAFPAGLGGELTRSTLPDSIATTRHLARLLRWDAYEPLVPSDPIVYDHTHVLEAVSAPHARYLGATSADVAPLALDDPPARVPDDVSAWFDRFERPRWLVAHTGPESEVIELLDYARDQATAEREAPSIVVVSPLSISGAPTVDLYPAWPLFAEAERVVTGAGFNAMRQAHAVAGASRHRFLPFPRRFDDQVERARRARSCTSPAWSMVPPPS
jgi:hypothetical protein